MSISILMSLGAILLLFVVISWIIPSFPNLVSAAVLAALRALSLYLRISIGVAAVGVSLLISGILAVISLWWLITFWIMVGAIYLAFRFRRQIVRFFEDLGVNRGALILIAVSLGILFLITVGGIVGPEIIAAICILTGITITVLVYLPVGIFLRIFGYRGSLVPTGLRTVLAGAGFIAFFGLMYPGEMTFSVLLISAVVAVILALTSFSQKAQQVVISMVVIVMIISSVWKYGEPDSYRAMTEYFGTMLEVVTTSSDRGRLEDRSEIAATYARVNRDIKVMYSVMDGSSLVESAIEPTLKAGSVIRIFEHKSSTLRYQGQEFIMIQRTNDKGTFVNGDTLWIEADYIDIVTPAQLRAEIKSQNEEQVIVPAIQQESQVVSGYYDKSGQYFMAPAGGETGLITVGPCLSYYFDNGASRITLYYPDGTSANSWEISKWPDKGTFRLKNWSKRPIKLIVL